MEYGKKLIWNGKYLVWNGYGMEEVLQNGIWKNRLPFHSIACPANKQLDSISQSTNGTANIFYILYHPKS